MFRFICDFRNDRLGAPLLKLARQQKFDKIFALLLRDYESEEVLIKWLTAPSSDPEEALQMFKGANVLHILLKYRPPSKLVDLIIMKLSRYEICREPETAVDMLGRTPLHVATYHACDVTVIRRLLSGSGLAAAMTKDTVGRYPLHWACANPNGFPLSHGRRRTGKITVAAVQNMELVVQELMKAFPQASLGKDKDGMVPYALAKKYEANQPIFDILKSFCPCPNCRNNTGSMTEEMSYATDIPRMIPGQMCQEQDDDVSSIKSGGVSRLLAATAT